MDAIEIMNELRSLTQASPIEFDGCQLTMTASFGVATLSSKDSCMSDVIVRYISTNEMVAIASILNHPKCYWPQTERSLRFQSSRAGVEISTERRDRIGRINVGNSGTDFRGISAYIL